MASMEGIVNAGGFFRPDGDLTGVTLVTAIQRMAHMKSRISHQHAGMNPKCVVDTEAGN